MATEYFLMNTNTAVLASPLAQPLGTLTEQPALAAVSLGLREMDQHKKTIAAHAVLGGVILTISGF